MHTHRDALCAGFFCLLLAAPALAQTPTGGTDARPMPSQRPGGTPATEHVTPWPHNDPRRQREETIEADRARKSGEMGYRRDSASDAASGAQQNSASPEPSRAGDEQPAAATREPLRAGGGTR
jgi:hypothetical protein